MMPRQREGAEDPLRLVAPNAMQMQCIIAIEFSNSSPSYTASPFSSVKTEDNSIHLYDVSTGIWPLLTAEAMSGSLEAKICVLGAQGTSKIVTLRKLLVDIFQALVKLLCSIVT